MEVRIGVRNVAREVSFESADSPDEVQTTVAKALASGEGVLTLHDDDGRTVMVPVAAVGYVEVGALDKGRVGFGSR